MSDPRPPFELLDAYQAGALPEAEAARFEEELFAAAAAGQADEADFVDRVSLIGQFLQPRGGFDIGSSRARVDQLIAAGLRVQVIDPVPAYQVQMPPIDDDAEIVVTHVPIDIRGYDSVDVVMEKPDGTRLKVFRDIQHDPIDGTVYALCEVELCRISLKQGHIRSRIIGTRAGQAHVIAEFETLTAP